MEDPLDLASPPIDSCSNSLTSRLRTHRGALGVRLRMVALSKLGVLHDFDNPYTSGRCALKRGLLLILYALSRKLFFLKPFCRAIYEENYSYAFTLQALDRLLGIESIFGINDRVEHEFAGLRTELDKVGARTVGHWHVSRDEVHWQPELDVPRSQWWFDQEYEEGKRSPKPDEWLVFHCDYPHLLPSYIRCLYELCFGTKLP